MTGFVVGAVLAGAAPRSRPWAPAVTPGSGRSLRRTRSPASSAATGGGLGVAAFDASGGSSSGTARVSVSRCAARSSSSPRPLSLQRVDRGEDRLSRFVRYMESDLLAPVTRARVSEGGMSLGDLCAAAVGVSDSTAGNLLVATLSGPPGLTRYCRSLGDTVTRLDRAEPTLNQVPGEVRDTTTAAAMLGLMRTILLGNALSETSRPPARDLVARGKGRSGPHRGGAAAWIPRGPQDRHGPGRRDERHRDHLARGEEESRLVGRTR